MVSIKPWLGVFLIHPLQMGDKGTGAVHWYTGVGCVLMRVCVGWMGGCDLYMGHVEWDSVKTHLEMHVY